MPLHWYLRSFINWPLFALRRHLNFSRSNYSERPVLTLTNLSINQKDHIAFLKKEYNVNFESHLNEIHSLESYHLLHLLHTTIQKLSWQPHKAQNLVDVGSKNFFYANALYSFFKPNRLTGIEIDAFRLYPNLHTRFSSAQYYIKNTPNTFYMVSDFIQYNEQAMGILLQYPYVTKAPLILADLPVSLFKPDALFKHARHLLVENGWLLMINQGIEEWENAKKTARDSGLILNGFFVHETGLLPRPALPVVSVWI
jgi:hypothetical protein